MVAHTEPTLQTPSTHLKSISEHDAFNVFQSDLLDLQQKAHQAAAAAAKSAAAIDRMCLRLNNAIESASVTS
jgi:hypothetical protein